MKVIFLDIDGVLNCQDTFIKRYEKKKITGFYELEIDINMVKRLSDIIKETNALIVLTSSWRIFFKYENGILRSFDKGKDLVKLLNEYNLSIYDMTPFDRNRIRDIEISRWLNNHDISNFIIIDDEKSELFKDNLILCNFYDDGLNEILKEEAISKLNCKENIKVKKV